MTDRQKMLAEGKKFREESLAWYDKMIETSEILSEEEKQAFDEWESTHVDGSGLFGTGDWPGWERYISELTPCSHNTSFHAALRVFAIFTLTLCST